MASRVGAILLAAGSGLRLGAGCAKALVPLGDLPLVRWSAMTLAAVEEITRLILLVPPGEEGRRVAQAAEGLEIELAVAEGGVRRRDSVALGLALAGSCDVVLVHDAARPFVSAKLVRRVLEAAARDGAAVPAVPVVDTLVRAQEGRVRDTIPRDELRAIQTPQGFSRELLERAHRFADPDWEASDDGSMVLDLGEQVTLVEGEEDNFKITWPTDLQRAREGLERTDVAASGGPAMAGGWGETRVGFGWDVHPLVEGRSYDLAGVRVAESFGPAGHSDGDPLCHAIADALLGAAGLGDIGIHFPDSDPRCAGLPGLDLLAQTVEKLQVAGWSAQQVDAVLITDRPKIAPHRGAICAALAGVLGVDTGVVSVKGKRSEGLGALADGAGSCCQCVVTLRRVGR